MPDKKGKGPGGVKACFTQMQRGLNDAYCVSDKSGETSKARSQRPYVRLVRSVGF